MVLTVEREKPPFEVRPEEVEIPEEIEAKEGVRATRTQITTQVKDDYGKPLTVSPATKTVSIEIPAEEEKLRSWSKGAKDNALTWFAAFWLRLIKKFKNKFKNVKLQIKI